MGSSGITRIKISANSVLKPRDISSSLNNVGRRMDKSSTSGGSAGSSNQTPSAGDKRPLTNPSQDPHVDDNEDETKRKKQKISSSGGSTSSGKEATGKEDTNA